MKQMLDSLEEFKGVNVDLLFEEEEMVMCTLQCVHYMCTSNH